MIEPGRRYADAEEPWLEASVDDEPSRVRGRYSRRHGDEQRYSLVNPDVLLSVQERQRAMLELFRRLGWRDLKKLNVLEVGCGTGANLLELLRLGCQPERLQGIELLEPVAERARWVPPRSVRVMTGDAASLTLPSSGDQDIVLQSTVFSSLLDDAFQQRLAARMWEWTRPGGGVLWYDFTINNPRNPDVRGVPVARIRQLFPQGRLTLRRLTLAPPIARAVTRVSPRLYPVFNACVWLRTHVLAWIEKPR